MLTQEWLAEMRLAVTREGRMQVADCEIVRLLDEIERLRKEWDALAWRLTAESRANDYDKVNLREWTEAQSENQALRAAISEALTYLQFEAGPARRRLEEALNNVGLKP
jgi:hypothetical protein